MTFREAMECLLNVDDRLVMRRADWAPHGGFQLGEDGALGGRIDNGGGVESDVELVERGCEHFDTCGDVEAALNDVLDSCLTPEDLHATDWLVE